MCVVGWPLNGTETGVDLVLIETFLLFLMNDAVLMLISRNLVSEVCLFVSKQGQLQPHFHSRARQLRPQL